ncbi:GFA family protein [Bdellovibrio sp. SKB1291214]|uniref:GFA family protein n=1 Tax=Bdellovibrio sp. SKB1291214 TaxID=1732569 RepID=UPI000B51DF7D|nr:GFA family protein [Bdellovibrio sp. SKB1291214]UYL09799.1 GFA family protein [Bdellovibrio sp. SKB1291214]
MKIAVNHPASCHCHSVKFEVELTNGIEDPKRCNCSFCRRRGTIVAMVPREKFKVLQGADRLSLYEFNTRTAKHYFCSVCGIHTHNVSRTNPHQIRFNVGCLEGVDPFELGDVPVSDGLNHPADRK